MAAILDAVLVRSLGELRELGPEELLERRYEKFRRIGQFFTELRP